MDFSFLTPCALFRRSQQREMRHCTATLLFAVILYDLHDLFPEQDMFIVDCLIAVVMSEQPVMILGLFLNLLKEIRERICLIVTVDCYGEISWGTVSDDVVHLFRRVVGYRISNSASTRLVTTTFRKAYAERGKPTELTFHSDRGDQYISDTFSKLLQNCHVKQSFSASGCPYDNTAEESFFATFKKEEAYRREYTSE